MADRTLIASDPVVREAHLIHDTEGADGALAKAVVRADMHGELRALARKALRGEATDKDRERTQHLQAVKRWALRVWCWRIRHGGR